MCEKKSWPTNRDLLTWFLFDQLAAEAPDGPGEIGEMLDEFERTSAMELHDILYAEYSEFAEQFASPDTWVVDPSVEEEEE